MRSQKVGLFEASRIADMIECKEAVGLPGGDVRGAADATGLDERLSGERAS